MKRALVGPLLCGRLFLHAKFTNHVQSMLHMEFLYIWIIG